MLRGETTVLSVCLPVRACYYLNRTEDSDFTNYLFDPIYFSSPHFPVPSLVHSSILSESLGSFPVTTLQNPLGSTPLCRDSSSKLRSHIQPSSAGLSPLLLPLSFLLRHRAMGLPLVLGLPLQVHVIYPSFTVSFTVIPFPRSQNRASGLDSPGAAPDLPLQEPCAALGARSRFSVLARCPLLA